MAVTVASDESWYNTDGFLGGRVVAYRTECLFHQLRCQFGIKDVLAQLVLRTDKVAAVHAYAVLHQRGDNV